MAREQPTMRSLQANAEELTKAAETQAHDAMAIQQELWSLFDETRRDWLKLVERDTQLASELSAALSSCKTMPEIAKAYQDWMSERVMMFGQESQRMFTNGQKFMTSAVTMIGHGAPRFGG
jgi:hypothetical protein